MDKNTTTSVKKIYLLLFLFATLLYANTINHGYVLDDLSVVKNNWVVKKGTEGLGTIFTTSYRHGYFPGQGTLYRPLSLAMFAIEWSMSPDNPALSHFINVLLYGLMAIMLFKLLDRLFQEEKRLLSIITVLLFIAHPIHTEVVANIKSRDELVSVLFVFVALYQLLVYTDRGEKKALVLSLISYFVAFLAKEGIITILGVIPLMLHFFRKLELKKLLTLSGMYAIPAVLYIIIRGKVLGNAGGIASVDPLDNMLKSTSSFSEQMATAIYLSGAYVWKLIVPHPLACDYSLNEFEVVGFGDWRVLLTLAVAIGLLFIAIKQFKSKSLVSFGILFYVITFSIYSNVLVVIGTSFGERLVFLPLLGLCLAVTHLILKKFNQLERSDVNLLQHKPLLGVLAVILIPYIGKTVTRNADWESNFTLYSADVKNSPNSARTHYYYALEIVQSQALKATNPQEKNKFLKMAAAEFSKAIEIYPKYPDAYDQLGLAYFRLGDNKQAVANYEQAIALNPSKSTTYSNLGAIFFNSQQYGKAEQVYLQAVKYDPAYADAYLNLGSVYAVTGRLPQSEEAYRNCLKFAPNNATANYYLGLTLKNLGKGEEAKQFFAIASSLNPKLQPPK